MRLQQLVPCEIEITSASSAAMCCADGSSPRADPAYPRFTTSSPVRRAATAGHAPDGPLAIQPSAIESPYASQRGPRGAGTSSPPPIRSANTRGRMPSGRYTTSGWSGSLRSSWSSAKWAVPGPRFAGTDSVLVARHERERGAGARAAVAEVVGEGLVVDLEGLGVTHELEAHADREARGAHGVAGQPVEVGGIGARVGHLVGARPRVAAQEGLGRRRRQLTGRPSGTGTWRPTPPSTMSVCPVT